MSQIPSSKLLGGPVDTTDAALIVTPDTAAPLKPGKYVFSVMVTDDLGMQSAVATLPVEVREGPGVRLSGPPVVAFNTNITLKADPSTAGTIKTFTWTVKQNA